MIQYSKNKQEINVLFSADRKELVTAHTHATARRFHAFLRDKPENNLRENAVLRFLCMRYWSQSEQ